MTFPSKGWIPDHCLSKRSASLTDVLTVKFRVSPTCTALQRERRQGKKGKKGQHLPATTTGACGKTKTPLCAGPTHQQRERIYSALKTCSPQNRCTGKICVTTRTCGRPSVHVRCHCADAIKNFPHAFARCVFELTSHLAGHVTTLYLVECGSVRNDN